MARADSAQTCLDNVSARQRRTKATEARVFVVQPQTKSMERRAAHADERERGDRIPERARVRRRAADARAGAAAAAAARARRRVRRGGGAGRAAAGAAAVEREDVHGALVGRHRQPLGAARERDGVDARRVRAPPQLLRKPIWFRPRWSPGSQQTTCVPMQTWAQSASSADSRSSCPVQADSDRVSRLDQSRRLVSRCERGLIK